MRRGEIRLVRLDPPAKTRPVLLLTRESSLPGLAHVTVATITRRIRAVPSEVLLGPDDGMKEACAINCHHLHTVRKSRVGRLLGELPGPRMLEVRRAMLFSLGFDA